MAPTDSRSAELLAQYQDDDGEEQRKRDRGAHDDGTTQIAEEHPLQQHDQQDADDHVVQHGVRRGVDQVLAIVDALDPNTRWQKVELLIDLTSSSTREMVGELCSPRRISTIPCTMSGRRCPCRRCRAAALYADRDVGNVSDKNRIAPALGHHGGGQIIDRADQSDAADHRRLRTDIDGVAADIDVGVADRLQQLRQGQAVRRPVC